MTIDGVTDDGFADFWRERHLATLTTLRADGIRQCLAGACSVEEITRVTGDRLL